MILKFLSPLGILAVLLISGCTSESGGGNIFGSCSLETASDMITDELAVSRGECIAICSDYWEGTGKSDPEPGPMGFYYCNCYTCDPKYKDYYKK